MLASWIYSSFMLNQICSVEAAHISGSQGVTYEGSQEGEEVSLQASLTCPGFVPAI